MQVLCLRVVSVVPCIYIYTCQQDMYMMRMMRKKLSHQGLSVVLHIQSVLTLE